MLLSQKWWKKILQKITNLHTKRFFLNLRWPKFFQHIHNSQLTQVIKVIALTSDIDYLDVPLVVMDDTDIPDILQHDRAHVWALHCPIIHTIAEPPVQPMWPCQAIAWWQRHVELSLPGGWVLSATLQHCVRLHYAIPHYTTLHPTPLEYNDHPKYIVHSRSHCNIAGAMGTNHYLIPNIYWVLTLSI